MGKALKILPLVGYFRRAALADFDRAYCIFQSLADSCRKLCKEDMLRNYSSAQKKQ